MLRRISDEKNDDDDDDYEYYCENYNTDNDDDDTDDDDYEDTQCTFLHSKCCVKQLQSQLALVATNTFSCHDYDVDDDDGDDTYGHMRNYNFLMSSSSSFYDTAPPLTLLRPSSPFTPLLRSYDTL